MAGHHPGHPGPPGFGVGGPNPQTKEVNTASLCRIGQETVQDILIKTTEIFNVLKTTQLPNGVSSSPANHQERHVKLQEYLRNISMLFKKLRLVYEKCNENCAGLDHTNPEELIPWLEEDSEVKPEHMPPTTEKFYFAKEEQKDIIEKIRAKNTQLKTIMDQLRSLMWDVNVMMMMSKT
ncbi:mediator of RNA polymerase II transcription subunit 30-like [Saccoglossus kowalevskii]|uniref:Mediator of RNA polymerase II transcription subunit 30 n=1 Tax=Saccoglossus kowalevskii TaxID=10224 RepID=A0ABM0GS92_SACKO|nr:PREDICTED: mediator of RNA polymerase II transcription subunit 30-like [Saccoglossus kowalevskii]